MGQYLKLFNTHINYLNFVNSGEMLRPNVSHCLQENEVHYSPIENFVDEYFTTIAREDGTISFNIWKSMGTDMNKSISYSTDNGETWTTIQNQNNKSEHLVVTVNVSEGDKVMWKGDATQLGLEYSHSSVGSFFSSTCEFDAQGNIMSLLYGDDFKGETTIESEYAFTSLFRDYDEVKTCKVVNTKNLSLPATALTNYCYSYMFNGCTSLATAPELPATTLASYCYSYMFNGCTSLATAPKLPATTLANECYEGMFYGCTSLTTAPELPATTLAQYCYWSMFEGCTSLTAAPTLPATTLVNRCYFLMFNGCTSLNSITCLATNISATDCTTDWVNGVASNGTFTKAASMTGWTRGNDGIPNGWTVQTVSE